LANAAKSLSPTILSDMKKPAKKSFGKERNFLAWRICIRY
jgi:hypothetical protein